MDEGQSVWEVLNGVNTHHPPPFVVDSKPSYGRPYYELHFYERCGNGALGMSHAEEDDSNVRRCFNCGEPGHEVTSCPQRRDHALISLSRQMFNFFKEESLASSQRLHEAEGWKRQRLAWLEEFEPGQVRGALLRDALGLRDGDPGEYVEWLGNIATWGYPKGWIGNVDPRLQVWKIIADEGRQDEAGGDDETVFTIAGEDLEELQLPSGPLPSSTLRDDDSVSAFSSESADTPVEEAADDDGCSQPRRWATYPNTYFLSSKLFVYNRQDVPQPSNELPCNATSITFDAERQALWDRIVNAPQAPALEPPPPCGTPPPPPPLTPPPLPPASPLPPLPPRAPSSKPPSPTPGQVDEDGENSDMDLSDTE